MNKSQLLEIIYLPAVCKDVIFFFFTLGVFSTSPVMEIEGPDHSQDKAPCRTFVIDVLWFKVLGGEGGSQQLFPVNSGRGWIYSVGRFCPWSLAPLILDPW